MKTQINDPSPTWPTKRPNVPGRHGITFLLTLLLLTCSGCQLTDMVRFAYDNANSTHSWAGENRKTTVPFTMIDNHIILPVSINGSEPLNFVLDSGAAATVIMESRHTRALDLEASSQITVSGVGSGPDPIANIVRETRINLGEIELAGQSVVYLPMESVPFFTGLDDVYFDGVIGAPFFRRFTVTIDHDTQQISFAEPTENPEMDTLPENWQITALEINGGVPYVSAEIANAQGQLVQVKLLADTGARGTVSLTPETHEELTLPTTFFETIGQGLSGDVLGQMTMSKNLVLGTHALGTLPVDYAVSGGETENNSNGILGNEVLNRFNTIFDYHNERLAFSPNRNYTRPFAADKSGLQLRPHVQGAIVRHIAEDSKAVKSSLQVGDIITSFNDTPVSLHTIGELKRSLSSDADSVELCWQSNHGIECYALPLASRFRQHVARDRG